MGVCVEMSGNGCRTFESMAGLQTVEGPFPALFRKLSGNALANVSRLDIACDDHDGILDMDTIIEKTQRNDVNSRMMKRQVVFSLDGTRRDGSTVYFGAPSSDFRVRIYDKAAEQGQDGHWVRVEMVFRGNNALGFVDQVVIGIPVGDLAAKVMNDKFCFIERDNKVISRCSVCDWWQNFVEDLESVCVFSRKVAKHAIEQVKSWVEKQVGPSLAMIVDSIGFRSLLGIIQRGQLRLSDSQKSVVMDYRSFHSSNFAFTRVPVST